MMNPADLQPPEEDLTAGLLLKSTDPSTVTARSGVPASSTAPEIAIMVNRFLQNILKKSFVSINHFLF